MSNIAINIIKGLTSKIFFEPHPVVNYKSHYGLINALWNFSLGVIYICLFMIYEIQWDFMATCTYMNTLITNSTKGQHYKFEKTCFVFCDGHRSIELVQYGLDLRCGYHLMFHGISVPWWMNPILSNFMFTSCTFYTNLIAFSSSSFLKWVRKYVILQQC